MATRLQARRLERGHNDPFRNLAAAVVHRAIEDALGRRLYGRSRASAALLAYEAQTWLIEGGDGLLEELDIDRAAMLDAMAQWERRNEHGDIQQLAGLHARRNRAHAA